jgi:hypothetical protein
MTLALWAVHRTFDGGGFRFGALAGLFLWLQVISCVYYGAFLGLIGAVLALLLLAVRPGQARAAIGPLCLGGLLAAVLTLPYALPYLTATRELGPRPAGEVLMFSAEWASYLAAPHQNWLWGWTAWGYGGGEPICFRRCRVPLARSGWRSRVHRLDLASRSLCWRSGRSASTAPSIDGYEHTFVSGFRAPARFAILARCATSVLAGFGYQFLQRVLAARPAGGFSSPWCWSWWPSQDPRRGSRPSRPRPPVTAPADGRAVGHPRVAKTRTDLHVWSTYWQWLVNGYSGYTGRPPRHGNEMRTFPDDESLARLRELGCVTCWKMQAPYQPADLRI